MLPVEQPFKVYHNIDGRPLQGGYVYFGEPNLNPITSPVTVYWDSEGTIPAAQPLRTLNGYIMRGGTPSNVFFDGPYSELVQDRHQQQVFYARNSDEFSIATQVSNLKTALAAPDGVSVVGGAAWFAPTIIGFNAAKVPDGATINFAGYNTPGDGGGGVFTYSEDSTQPGDNGLVFEPLGGGRLFRQGWTIIGFNGTISPRFFGAKGDGMENDITALMDTVSGAYSFGTAQVIDLAGGSYATQQPIELPPGGNVTIQNGTFKATNSFPTDRHLIECTSQSGGLVHHDLKFDNLVLDANHRGGCLVLDNYIRITVKDCKLLHFSTDGLWLRKSLDSHECVVTGCSAFEYLYNEPGYLTPTDTSVGYRVDSFDNLFVANVSYYTGTGMVINAQYNLVSQAHLGGSKWALQVTENAAFSTFHQCYFDLASVQVVNPWNTEFNGCKFLTSTSDSTFSFMKIKPLVANLGINGFKVINCTFHNNQPTLVDSISLDGSVGTFNNGAIVDCHVHQNSFVNAKRKGTRIRKSLYQNASVTWEFNFDNELAFGSVQNVQDSYYDATSSAPVSRVTNIVGNTVTVTNSVAGNGTVFIEVDVNSGIS